MRTLAPREVATIRAALRLWITTNPELIPDVCWEEAGDESPLDDTAVEQLLLDLIVVGDRLVIPSGAARMVTTEHVLLREALDALTNPETRVDVKDWTKAAQRVVGPKP
jgi:hypothetical protein